MRQSHLHSWQAHRCAPYVVALAAGVEGRSPPPRSGVPKHRKHKSGACANRIFTAGRRTASAPHVIAPAAGVEGRSPPPRSGVPKHVLNKSRTCAEDVIDKLHL